METQTKLEIHRRKAIVEEGKQLAMRSVPSLSQYRFDLGDTRGKAQRSSVDRIVFGHGE